MGNRERVRNTIIKGLLINKREPLVKCRTLVPLGHKKKENKKENQNKRDKGLFFLGKVKD